MARWAGPGLGGVALLALVGAAKPLPHQVAFFVCALAVILFPGMALTSLIARGAFGRDSLPERLAVWFVVGAGSMAALGLLGLVLKAHLRDVIVISAVAYAVLIALLILRKARDSDPGDVAALRLQRMRVSPVTLILIAIAAGFALITLLTPRDYDDWYYLAYISDYAAGARLAAEDAIFDMGNPVAPRIWFGGGWWVFEALLAKASGIDPVACHQIYLPLLLIPFVVLAVYTLARRLFPSAWAALLACGFQMLFYLSGAFPFKSTGWMVFARIAQDKAVACFIVAPVAASLALRLLDGQEENSDNGGRRVIRIYWIAVLTSVLIHGMGPVWTGLLVIPPAIVEWMRLRSRASALNLVRTALPMLACAAVLVALRPLVMAVVTAPPQEMIPAPGVLSGLYLPGMPFKLGTDTTNPLTWIFREGFFTLNPLFIMRYPLAIAGLVLTFSLFLFVRSSRAARFLLAVTASVLLLLFTPIGIALAGSFITQRLVFRLVWILPWGLIITYVLVRLGLRPLLNFLLLGVVALTLTKGNPTNYNALFAKMQGRNRPSADAVDAFRFLASQPSPQGVVLACEATGRMIPAFLPDAYPVNFREYGPVGREDLMRLVERRHIDPVFVQDLDSLGVSFILIERGKPLDGALRQGGSGFVALYESSSYSVWKRGVEDSRR